MVICANHLLYLHLFSSQAFNPYCAFYLHSTDHLLHYSKIAIGPSHSGLHLAVDLHAGQLYSSEASRDLH